MKKYLVISTLLVTSALLLSLRIEFWHGSIQSLINKNMINSGWEFQAEKYSGYLFSTIILKNVKIRNDNGISIDADKMTLNLNIISTIIDKMVFDLLTVEGMLFNYKQDYIKKNIANDKKDDFIIPFDIKSFFIDSKIITNINDQSYTFNTMLAGELKGFNDLLLNCDLLRISLESNQDYFCKLDNIILGISSDSYFVRQLDGDIFGLPVYGNISIGRLEPKLSGKINVREFSFPKELFSKLPLKTKFSKFKGEFIFESDFENFTGELSLGNSLGLDMLGHFKLKKENQTWIINSLELEGENSKLYVNGLWEEGNRINCFMDLKNLDLSNWMNYQNPTEMSGLFIFDAGFANNGALDRINMNLEMVESKLFNQGEISIHGQFYYSDSIISTIDPVMLMVGDSYLTINGEGDFKSRNIDFYTDMEQADISLINSFLPGNFVSGKATGNLRVNGNIYEPSAKAELTCENVSINSFRIQSIKLNSHITVTDSVPEGFVDIKTGQGIWKDRKFESGTLSALVNDKAVTIENFHFKSGNDFLQASGQYDGIDEYKIDRIQLVFEDDYLINAKPLSFTLNDSVFQLKPFELHINDGLLEGSITGMKNPQGRLKMSNFDSEILTQFLDDDRLKFSGLIFGEVWFQLIDDNFDIDTDIALKKGTYMQETFDEMNLSGLYRNNIFHIDDISMTRKGEMGLQAAGIIPIKNNGKGHSKISLSSSFSNLSLSLVHRFIPKFFDIGGKGTGSINLKGTLEKTEFNYNLNVSDATFDLISLGNVSSKGSYDGKSLYVSYAKSASKEGEIAASGYLPFDLNIGSPNFSKMYKNDNINFVANANIRSLPFLSPYIDDLDSAEGDFIIELSLSGTATDIIRNGNIKIQNGKLHTLLFTDPIESINGGAVMVNNQLIISNLDFLLFNTSGSSAKPPDKNTFVEGTLDFSKFFDPVYDIKIKSVNASYKLLFLDIYGESDLDLTISGRDTVLIAGKIETQKANVFYEFNTEDVGTLIQQDNENIFAYNLNIPIRGEAYFNNSQINAKVNGELNLSQVGNQEVDFGGQIIVEDGSVYSYTDYFTKLQGLVSFDNKGFNPNIDVSASTKIGEEEIYLSMKGGIEDLDIILESQNEFSESDILELLTWGKRIEDQEWTSTGFGNQTVSILGTLLENQIEKNLKDSNIGMMNYVDDIEISGAASLLKGTDDDFEVTTKTKLSDKAFINLSYKRSFSLNQPRVGVEYKLNRHFSVVGNVDDQGKLNLKYRYRYAY